MTASFPFTRAKVALEAIPKLEGLQVKVEVNGVPLGYCHSTAPVFSFSA
jgi:hypothetical protein